MVGSGLCLIFFFGFPGVEIIQPFESPPVAEALVMPFAVTKAKNGRWYVLDSLRSRLLVWEQDGRFHQAFGTEGLGPQELSRAVKIGTMNNLLWVWGYNGNRLTYFDLDGQFIDSIQTGIRFNHAAMLSKETFLIGYKHHRKPGVTEVPFLLVDHQANIKHELKRYPHNGYLQRKDSYRRIKAYGPDIVIQNDQADDWYFGFSQTRMIFRLNDEGAVAWQKRFELPEQIALDDDKKRHFETEFTGYNGERVRFADTNPGRYDFSFPMAFYTQFGVSQESITFLLTPLGGFGIGSGYHEGRFYRCSKKTGEVIDGGLYRLPPDSKVLFSRGEAMAFIIGSDDDYQVSLLRFVGKAGD